MYTKDRKSAGTYEKVTN